MEKAWRIQFIFTAYFLDIFCSYKYLAKISVDAKWNACKSSIKVSVIVSTIIAGLYRQAFRKQIYIKFHENPAYSWYVCVYLPTMFLTPCSDCGLSSHLKTNLVTLKMEAETSSETSEPYYPTRLKNPDDYHKISFLQFFNARSLKRMGVSWSAY
jgi:hypothetical protein